MKIVPTISHNFFSSQFLDHLALYYSHASIASSIGIDSEKKREEASPYKYK